MSVRPVSEAISRYVVPWLQLDWPIRWLECFQREAALRVEIGFGNGLFLIEQARRVPEVNFIGIELSWGSVQHLAMRLDSIGLTHVRLIHGEAQACLQHLFTSNAIQEIWINFPDPWPKKRHHARRLIQPELLALLHDRLAGGGRLTMATDHADYAAWIAALLEAQANLQSCFPTTAVHDLARRTPTKYEQRARGAALPVHYFVWYKPLASAPTSPTGKKGAMPHVVLAGTQDLDRTVRSWTPRTWNEVQQGVEVSIALLRIYREITEDSWLLELMVKEGTLSQQIGVTIVPRAHGQTLIKLSPVGFPRPTWGVQRAVWRVARMLQESDTQSRVLWMSMAMLDEGPGEMSSRSRRRGSRQHSSASMERPTT